MRALRLMSRSGLIVILRGQRRLALQLSLIILLVTLCRRLVRMARATLCLLYRHGIILTSLF